MKKKTTKLKAIVLIISIVLSVCSIIGGITFAKYLHGKDNDGVVVAKNFYFTSNLLDGKAHEYTPGITSVSFLLGNHADDLRYSEMDIDYEVIVTHNGAKQEATIANSNNTNKGTLQQGVISDEIITVSNLEAGITYTISAVGKGKDAYKKTLTATITILQAVSELYYYIDDSLSEYTLLTIWNDGDKEGTIKITYTGIPDNTLPHMSDWTTNSNKDVSVNPHESKQFRFFTGTVSVENATEKALN